MSSWIWERTRGSFVVPAVCVDDRLDENCYRARKTATLADCAAHALRVAEASGYDSFSVVGHSGAGPVAAMLAAALGGRLRRVVYVAANIPPHGRTMIDSLPLLLRLVNVAAVRGMIKRDSTPYAKYEKAIREKFGNDSPEDVVKLVLSKEMRSEPLCAVTERMDWSRLPPMDQSYIVLTRDRTLSPARQREMAANLGIKRIVELEGDHMVMLSRPREFADALNGMLGAA